MPLVSHVNVSVKLTVVSCFKLWSDICVSFLIMDGLMSPLLKKLLKEVLKQFEGFYRLGLLLQVRDVLSGQTRPAVQLKLPKLNHFCLKQRRFLLVCCHRLNYCHLVVTDGYCLWKQVWAWVTGICSICWWTCPITKGFSSWSCETSSFFWWFAHVRGCKARV